MTCRDVAGFLNDYVAGELPPTLAAEFESHLDACSNCREFLAQYRATIAVSAAAWNEGDLEAPPELVAGILTMLQSPPG